MKALLAFLFVLVATCVAQEASQALRKEMNYEVSEDGFVAIASPLPDAANDTQYFMCGFSTRGFPQWRVAKLDLEDVEIENVQELLRSIQQGELSEEIREAVTSYRFGIRSIAEVKEAGNASAPSNETESGETEEEEACLSELSQISNQLFLINFRDWSEISEEVETVNDQENEEVEIRIFNVHMSLLGTNVTLKTYLAEAPVEYNNKSLGPDRCKMELELKDYIFLEEDTKLAFLAFVESADEASKEEEKVIMIGEEGRLEFLEKEEVEGGAEEGGAEEGGAEEGGAEEGGAEEGGAEEGGAEEGGAEEGGAEEGASLAYTVYLVDFEHAKLGEGEVTVDDPAKLAVERESAGVILCAEESQTRDFAFEAILAFESASPGNATESE